MAKARIAVLCVHGMGNQPVGFADGMIEELRTRLKDRGVNPDLFAFAPAWWGPIMEGAESKLYARLSQGADLDWATLRKDIVISGFGDALAYVGPPNGRSEVYGKIHEVLGAALEEVTAELEDPDSTPLVVMAHSLGCAIASNYIWDAQKGVFAQTATCGFSRCQTLLGLVTFGCNLPLFTLAYKPADIMPIARTGPGVGACFDRHTDVQLLSKWLNFYDPDDILGYPLRGLNRHYADAVTADIAIDTGTILGAHTDYWTDNDFTTPVADYLVSIARALPPSRG